MEKLQKKKKKKKNVEHHIGRKILTINTLE